MICLHCGYCCKNFMVGIVDNPALGIREDNLKVHMGNDTPCPHLLGDKPGEYKCALHNEPWYPETPCFAHGQVERENSNCRMGAYIMKELK